MTNITVNQLIGLMATDHLFDFVKLEFYDEVHQISETTDEHAMETGNAKYNWGDAVIEYWYPENERTLSIKCTLPNTVPLELIAIAVSLDAIAESLSLIRDNACEKYKFDDLLDMLHTWRAELCRRSKNPRLTAEDPDTMKATAVLLNDFDEFIIDIMVAAESERETDACAVNILNSECIATLTLTR